jgi:nucleolar protein 4
MAAQEAKKSVDNTVFVRFQPPSDAIRRHHVEDLFSDCGPIKKTSVIHTGGKDQQPVTSSYGFVKYTVAEDAALAAVKLNNRTLKVAPGVTVTVKVELAKTEQTDPKAKRRAGPSISQPKEEAEEEDESHKKKTNRLILRNLSFYAKETDIRKALTPFGELLEVHIPTVQNVKGATHRGFCFVTFATEKAVKKCLAVKEPVVIKERAVNIARSLHKTAYQSQTPIGATTRKSISSTAATITDNKGKMVVVGESDANNKHGEKDDRGDEDDELDGDDKTDDGSDIDENDEDSDADGNDEGDEAGDSSPSKQNAAQNDDKTAVAEGRCLFLRNLPFDCTRHDIFEAFRQFGFVTSIYIVKDKETNKIPKGTAFVSFQNQEQATKALEHAAPAGSSNFVSQRNVATLDSGISDGGIAIKGRRLLVDLAVDKQTASTLTLSESKQTEAGGKDRRNLRLKMEGRVENDEKAGKLEWDELPEGDKLKRQTAWSEKNTKLRSPLFFINPNRLSIRNLAKHVDEAALKKVIFEATMRGLSNGLVSVEDQVAHWRAQGEMTTREILKCVQESVADANTNAPIIPILDEKNVKQSIPAVHIHRDVAPGGNKKLAPSRGFGFVEFEHHIHALACLRELNNNTRYSEDYATGGKQAMEMKRRRMGKKLPRNKPAAVLPEGEAPDVDGDGRVRIPRLIVEFTVENKAKAKQQAAHKAQQQANITKQRVERVDKDGNKEEKSKAKKSRGAAQREKKRKRKEGAGDADQTTTGSVETAAVESPPVPLAAATKRVKLAKPPVKRKVDKREVSFSKLVASYEEQSMEAMKAHDAPETKKSTRRWFE